MQVSCTSQGRPLLSCCGVMLMTDSPHSLFSEPSSGFATGHHHFSLPARVGVPTDVLARCAGRACRFHQLKCASTTSPLTRKVPPVVQHATAPITCAPLRYFPFHELDLSLRDGLHKPASAMLELLLPLPHMQSCLLRHPLQWCTASALA